MKKTKINSEIFSTPYILSRLKSIHYELDNIYDISKRKYLKCFFSLSNQSLDDMIKKIKEEDIISIDEEKIKISYLTGQIIEGYSFLGIQKNEQIVQSLIELPQSDWERFTNSKTFDILTTIISIIISIMIFCMILYIVIQ